MTTPWHAPTTLLAQFATEPDALGDAAATSIETHLTSCATCRAVVAEHTDQAWLAQSWNALADAVDRPRRTLAERLLSRIVPDDIARVVAATRGLRVAWGLAVVAIAVGLTLLSRTADSVAPFLLFAPSLPLASVVTSFHPVPEPGGEAALAAPLQGAGMVLRRTVAVLVTTFAVMAPVVPFLPGVGWWAAAWVLPALAVTALALALCTWFTPPTAVAVIALTWGGAVYALPLASTFDATRLVRTLFGPGAQLAWLTVVVVAVAVTSTRRDHLSMLEAR